jgi:hypothetical protein
MLACDTCQEWYHPRCVGIDDIKVELVDAFVCPRCPNTRTTWKTKCRSNRCFRPAIPPLTKCVFQLSSYPWGNLSDIRPSFFYAGTARLPAESPLLLESSRSGRSLRTRFFRKARPPTDPKASFSSRPPSRFLVAPLPPCRPSTPLPPSHQPSSNSPSISPPPAKR